MSTGPPGRAADEPLARERTGGRTLSKRSVGRRERIASAAVGGVLIVAGLRRRSIVGAAMALAGGWLFYRGVAGKAVPRPDAGHQRRESAAGSRATKTTKSVTIGKSADELYELWRDPETMTRIFGEYIDVTAPSEDRRRWTVSAPFGQSLSWETRFVEERPGEFLRWESIGDERLSAEGTVRFHPAPADRGTQVTFQIDFDTSGGVLGDAVAERLGIVPDTITEKALNRFKSLAETGEVPTLDKNPSGRGEGDLV